jgi:phage shock protein A
MLSQKDELIAALRNEKNELDNNCQKLQADYNELHETISGLELRIDEAKVNFLIVTPFTSVFRKKSSSLWWN